MPLPELIELVPLLNPAPAEISVPGSKSITNRALVLAALSEGRTTLQGALWSEDTQVMVEALQALGFDVEVAPDAEEFCNRTISVRGLGGKVPNSGTVERPLEIFVANAGTAARFLTALLCLGSGVYRVSGVARMHQRPQAPLFTALRELGYKIESPNDKLPALIHGAGPRRGTCRVSIEESSQFASALILGSQQGGWTVKTVGENAEESPYVKMTELLLGAFPHRGGSMVIEPDASSGSYFWAANGVVSGMHEHQPHPIFSVRNWPTSGWQIDSRFADYVKELFLPATVSSASAQIKLQADPSPQSSRTISRLTDLGDSIMTAIVIAPFSREPTRFINLGRLRVQECERVVALRTELTKCGARVIETGDILEIFPSDLHGAEIETYDDHRMAMCFAILGLKVPGMKIRNPACVRKTFPNFFQKLAAAPPRGLGVTILDAKTCRILSLQELFAS